MSEYTNADCENGAHPPEDDLRLYADGELENRISGLVKAHLDACWSCRVKLDEVEATIADFIGYRTHARRALVPPPPNNWRGFETRLDRPMETAARKSWWTPFVFRRTIRFAAGLIIMLAAIASWIMFNREPVIAAAELLDRAAVS